MYNLWNEFDRGERHEHRLRMCGQQPTVYVFHFHVSCTFIFFNNIYRKFPVIFWIHCYRVLFDWFLPPTEWPGYITFMELISFGCSFLSNSVTNWPVYTESTLNNWLFRRADICIFKCFYIDRLIKIYRVRMWNMFCSA